MHSLSASLDLYTHTTHYNEFLFSFLFLFSCAPYAPRVRPHSLKDAFSYVWLCFEHTRIAYVAFLLPVF